MTQRRLAKTVEMPCVTMDELMAELGGECRGLPQSHGPSTLAETQELPAISEDIDSAIVRHLHATDMEVAR